MCVFFFCKLDVPTTKKKKEQHVLVFLSLCVSLVSSHLTQYKYIYIHTHAGPPGMCFFPPTKSCVCVSKRVIVYLVRSCVCLCRWLVGCGPGRVVCSLSFFFPLWLWDFVCVWVFCFQCLFCIHTQKCLEDRGVCVLDTF